MIMFKEARDQVVQVCVSRTELKAIDGLADETFTDRSNLCRGLILSGIKELE